MDRAVRRDYFLGLDVGTDSVGYAATDCDYNLLKFKGEPMWGVHLFEEAKGNDERRAHRTARRRLDRKQNRIHLLQELFAHEIEKIDPNFFIRIKESRLYPEDTTSGAMLFQGPGFTDAEYHRQYPTIHHLIVELMKSDEAHDVRLVYLACAWLLAHRGHFLNEISKENIHAITDIRPAYDALMGLFPEDKPWQCDDLAAFGSVLKGATGINRKYKELCALLYQAPKVPKLDDAFPLDREMMLKALCGGKITAEKLFRNPDYAEVEALALDKADDELAPILASLGENAEVVLKLKALYDWSVLSDILHGEMYLSVAKVKVYEQHRKDLAELKYMIRTYRPEKYGEVFRRGDGKKVNYEAYAKGSSKKQEEFCKYIEGLLKTVKPAKKDEARFARMIERLKEASFCPKQINSNNRVVPYQVYWVELKKVLDNAANYLPFLNRVEDGSTVCEKILSIFAFRVPYFVGPLNEASNRAWVKRKAAGRIMPWNFEEMVDLEASEQAFIDRMTNSCTYLAGADVMPKQALCYERFLVLNEINPIAINGRRMPVEVKQHLFRDLFLVRRKVTKKAIQDFLLSNNYYSKQDLVTLEGIDNTIKASLLTHMAFHKLMERGFLTEADVEQIIERRAYTESKSRFSAWLNREYPGLSEEDSRYLCSLKIKEFGRLSRELLCGIYGTEADSQTGEAFTILERMWQENVTLMEILSERYTYGQTLRDREAEFYGAHKRTLDERLKDMYIENAVRRPILRAVDIVADVVKANGAPPRKIFVEMACGGRPEEKGGRTKSRYQQICELYQTCEDEDVRELMSELDAMGENVESRLQGDKLFLYYMQLGKCMYTGERIDLAKLGSNLYDIDHIYPQSKVRDDSVLNNKILVLSTANAEKGDRYPIDAAVRTARFGLWQYLHNAHFISDEKFKRLTRATPFREEEQWAFINRQLVETRQSTKALATVLKELYPAAEIACVKAGLVSEFRHEFDMVKCRTVNDLYHAKDAYLTIVVGNVHHERFTKTWFLAHREDYNLKVKTLFTHPVHVKGKQVWAETSALEKVKQTVQKNNAVRYTRYMFARKGGLFDQQPVAAAPGLIPLKKGLPTEKYGGYNKATTSFFVLTRCETEKGTNVIFMSVELLYAQRFLTEDSFAEEYAKHTLATLLGRPVLAVSFPLGKRVIKIGTIIEFDRNMRMCISGKSSGGKILLVSGCMPLIVGYRWEKYIKRLEVFVEKKRSNPRLIYSAEYDLVTSEENLELYDILSKKLSAAPYEKRPANPRKDLVKRRDKFEILDVFEQATCLMQILMVFGRANGCDLSRLGSASRAGIASLNSSIRNWKKNYFDVRIVDTSASGLFGRKSQNLLDLL